MKADGQWCTVEIDLTASFPCLVRFLDAGDTAVPHITSQSTSSTHQLIAFTLQPQQFLVDLSHALMEIHTIILYRRNANICTRRQ